MSFKITAKSKPQNEYSKVYLKLIGLEFSPDVSDKTPNKKKIESAKEYYKEIYKSLCLDLSKCEWQVEDGHVIVQTCMLFKQPDQVIKVVHDHILTLIYSKELFKVTDTELIKKVELGVENL